MNFEPPSSPETPAASRGRLGATVLAVSIACLAYAAVAPLMLAHGDLGWHLAAGDLIRELGHVPEHDPWSFTAGDKRWFNISWGWDVVASLLVAHGSLWPLLLLTLATGGLIAALLAMLCLRCGASPLATVLAVSAASLLYPFFAVPDLFLSASPNLATMLFCVVFFTLCLTRRRLWLAPLFMLLWVNMHGGFVLGLMMLGVATGLGLLRGEPQARSLAAVLAASVLATLANPMGLEVYRGVLGTVGHFVQDYITEWRPYLTSFTWPNCVPTFAFIALFVGLELTARNSAPMVARILSWGFLVLGLTQLRYLSIFFLFSTVPLSIHLSARLGAWGRGRDSGNRMLVAGLTLAALIPFVLVQHVPGKPDFPPTYPRAEVAALQRRFPRARLLNHWNYGTALIHETRGGIPVFVDGRAATAYPDELLRDYFRLVSPEVDERAWSDVLAKYRIDTVMWVKAHAAAGRFLQDRLGWTKALSGEIADIYVKPGSEVGLAENKPRDPR